MMGTLSRPAVISKDDGGEETSSPRAAAGDASDHGVRLFVLEGPISHSPRREPGHDVESAWGPCRANGTDALLF